MELENDGADAIADKGYRVHQNPTKQEIADALLRTGDIVDPRRSPDYLIESHVFDCYSPSPTTSTRAVWSAVKRKVDDAQTQRVAVNLRDWGGDLTALRKQFHDWPVPGLEELVAITRSGTIVQFLRRT
ncbi:hypothetical protein ABZ793_31830 [Micromonospora sp. NPDC047465]|uniref:CdiA C-terminal domain-containing protein n=1 Tax=Micromonospora sp. NPDC047465 TaxID=3154813 RepID=UPI0033E3F8E9